MLSEPTTFDWISALEAIKPLTGLVQPVASTVIAVIAVSNFVLIQKFNKEQNRPIISACFRIKTPTNSHNIIEFVILNSGNRPATNITVFADRTSLESCVFSHLGTDDNQYWQEILKFFQRGSVIALLPNGEEHSIDMYRSTVRWAKDDASLWRQQCSFTVRIAYEDLSKNEYESILDVGTQ